MLRPFAGDGKGSAHCSPPRDPCLAQAGKEAGSRARPTVSDRLPSPNSNSRAAPWGTGHARGLGGLKSALLASHASLSGWHNASSRSLAMSEKDKSLGLSISTAGLAHAFPAHTQPATPWQSVLKPRNPRIGPRSLSVIPATPAEPNDVADGAWGSLPARADRKATGDLAGSQPPVNRARGQPSGSHATSQPLRAPANARAKRPGEGAALGSAHANSGGTGSGRSARDGRGEYFR